MAPRETAPREMAPREMAPSEVALAPRELAPSEVTCPREVAYLERTKRKRTRAAFPYMSSSEMLMWRLLSTSCLHVKMILPTMMTRRDSPKLLEASRGRIRTTESTMIVRLASSLDKRQNT